MEGYTRKVNEYFHAAHPDPEWVGGRLEAG